MKTCVIMHNMIIEDERDEHGGQYEYHFNDEGQYVCNYDDMGAWDEKNVVAKLWAFLKTKR